MKRTEAVIYIQQWWREQSQRRQQQSVDSATAQASITSVAAQASITSTAAQASITVDMTIADCCKQAHLHSIQARLEAAGLAGENQLCALPPVPDSVEINQERFENYCATFSDGASETREAMRELINEHLMHITFDDLLASLKRCVADMYRVIDEANEGDDESRFAIAVLPGKSQKWVADLALRFMDRLPTAVLPLKTDSGKGAEIRFPDQSLEKIRKHNIQTVVIFDDASFSGAQLTQTLENVNFQFAGKVITVVPYMTQKAIERVNTFGKFPACFRLQCVANDMWDDLAYNIKLHIINDTIIPCLAELPLSLITKFRILNASNTREGDFELSNNCDEARLLQRLEWNQRLAQQADVQMHHCRYAFFDWKIPDAVSVDGRLVAGVINGRLNRYYGMPYDGNDFPPTRFIPKIKPVYKQAYGAVEVLAVEAADSASSDDLMCQQFSGQIFN